MFNEILIDIMLCPIKVNSYCVLCYYPKTVVIFPIKVIRLEFGESHR